MTGIIDIRANISIPLELLIHLGLGNQIKWCEKDQIKEIHRIGETIGLIGVLETTLTFGCRIEKVIIRVCNEGKF